jgi:hypothetical protein
MEREKPPSIIKKKGSGGNYPTERIRARKNDHVVAIPPRR